MSDQTSDSEITGAPVPGPRTIQPFEFLRKPEEPGGAQTFEQFLARRDEAPVHPSLLGDVPDDDDD